MNRGNYSVYHYDTHERKTADAILKNIDINSAHHVAKTHALVRATNIRKKVKEVPAGENCAFQIEGERMGFIVMKNGVGPDYETARKSQLKSPAR